jgi:hypothetical protein
MMHIGKRFYLSTKDCFRQCPKALAEPFEVRSSVRFFYRAGLVLLRYLRLRLKFGCNARLTRFGRGLTMRFPGGFDTLFMLASEWPICGVPSSRHVSILKVRCCMRYAGELWFGGIRILIRRAGPFDRMCGRRRPRACQRTLFVFHEPWSRCRVMEKMVA